MGSQIPNKHKLDFCFVHTKHLIIKYVIFEVSRETKALLHNVSANCLVPLEKKTLEKVQKKRVGSEITLSKKNGLEHQFVNHVFRDLGSDTF